MVGLGRGILGLAVRCGFVGGCLWGGGEGHGFTLLVIIHFLELWRLASSLVIM